MPAQWTPCAVLFNFLGISIAGRIVGRVVVLQTIGDAFDKRRAAAGARSGERLGHRIVHGEDIVSVGLQDGYAAGYSLLRERLGRRLAAAWG